MSWRLIRSWERSAIGRSGRSGSRLAQTLYVPVRGFTCPARRAHGHMADRTRREGWYRLENSRSGGMWPLRVKRSVNRRLSLRWFEPNTCHHQRKRPAAWGFSGFAGRRALCHRRSEDAAAPRWLRTNSGQNPGRRSGSPHRLLRPIAASHRSSNVLGSNTRSWR
jgi:hypothetical protein